MDIAIWATTNGSVAAARRRDEVGLAPRRAARGSTPPARNAGAKPKIRLDKSAAPVVKASTTPSIVALAGLLAATNVANNGGAPNRPRIPPPTPPTPAPRARAASHSG